MEETPRHIASELLKDLAELAADLASKILQASPRKREEFGRELAFRISENWGGLNIYFPKNMAGRRSKRNEEIYSRFNGSNQAELALEYNLTVQMIYLIIKSERAARMQKQYTLPT